MEIAPVSMEFRYGSSFGVEPPEAYERLLLDCLLGDSTLFTRADEVEASWAWVSRIHRRWAEEAAAGTSAALRDLPGRQLGTAAADRLMTADGRAWRLAVTCGSADGETSSASSAASRSRSRSARSSARWARCGRTRPAPATSADARSRGRRCGT